MENINLTFHLKKGLIVRVSIEGEYTDDNLTFVGY